MSRPCRNRAGRWPPSRSSRSGPRRPIATATPLPCAAPPRRPTNCSRGVGAAEAPGWSASPRVHAALLRGVAELWAGRPDEACRLLAHAVDSYPPGSFNAYGEVYYRGVLALAQAGVGRLSLARASAEAALEMARRQGRSALLREPVGLAGAVDHAAVRRRRRRRPRRPQPVRRGRREGSDQPLRRRHGSRSWPRGRRCRPGTWPAPAGGRARGRPGAPAPGHAVDRGPAHLAARGPGPGAGDPERARPRHWPSTTPGPSGAGRRWHPPPRTPCPTAAPGSCWPRAARARAAHRRAPAGRGGRRGRAGVALGGGGRGSSAPRFAGHRGDGPGPGPGRVRGCRAVRPAPEPRGCPGAAPPPRGGGHPP